MTAPVIDIQGLEKRYGSVRALDGLTLACPPGPVGLLGPNGAGKTTLIKLLLGLLVPDGGRATVAGHDPRDRNARIELRRAVGYMPEGDCLIPGMSSVELVSMLGRISGLSRADALQRAHEALDYVGLDESRYRNADQYSTGMKQRLKLAQALVHDPQIVLLDEPTNGLDPRGRRHMLDLVHDLGHTQKKNILLCSHLLPDVERTCDEVIVLDKGRVVVAGKISELTGGGGRAVALSIDGARDRFAAELVSVGYACDGAPRGDLIVRLGEGQADVDQIFAIASRSGARLTGVKAVRSTLEQVFLDGLSAGDRIGSDRSVDR
jgi:ABC-2 type transport system ATP-binding protein